LPYLPERGLVPPVVKADAPAFKGPRLGYYVEDVALRSA
jgi:hypothetical protein